MKGIFLLLSLMMLLSVGSVLISCTEPMPVTKELTPAPTQVPMPTQTPTPEIVTPTPIPAEPNTGVATGHVSYFDNMPASQMEVWFFKQGETSSDKEVLTDAHGNYTSNVPIGTYEIYTATFRLDSPVGPGPYQVFTTKKLLPPDATITVNDQQTITVPTIMIPREMTQIYYDDIESLIDITSPTKDITVIQPATFSWVTVSNASNYSVLFERHYYRTSNYDTTHDDISIMVTSANVTLPLSQSGNYELQVRAFDKQGTEVAEGVGWFIIK